MLYGEGSRAFLRLQEEIIKRSNDQSIFAWADSHYDGGAEQLDAGTVYVKADWSITKWITGQLTWHALSKGNKHGLLADRPAAFAHFGSVTPQIVPKRQGTPYQMSNQGLGIILPVKKLTENIFVGLLECTCRNAPQDNRFLCIYLIQTTGVNQYSRVQCEKLVVGLSPESTSIRHLFVRQEVNEGVFTLPTSFLLLRGLLCRTDSYTATDITSIDSLDDISDHECSHEADDSSKPSTAHPWVPSHLRKIFKIPCSSHTLLTAIRLTRESDGEHLVILIGTGTNRTTHLGFAVTDKNINLYDFAALQATFSRTAQSVRKVMLAGEHHVTTAVHAYVQSGHIIHAIDLDIKIPPKDRCSEKVQEEGSNINPSETMLQRPRTMLSWLFTKGVDE